ncbi:peroxiredoxin [Thalassobaculum sp.]|uniref:peroxiredoxin n=1 Tax=Thalassobaculum sp. TaxID=2022740 RepID=UPI003B5A6DA2
MTIKVGDKLPDVGLQHKTADGIDTLDNAALFAGKKVVLFAVPGAFTPTCSAKHVPSFVQNIDALKAKGVDTVACVAVNDPFVMGVWGKDQASEGKVMMLADGSAKFTKAIGLELDLTERGLGVRSQRYAMVVDDGTVSQLFVEEAGAYDVSSAENVLKHL